MPDEETVSAGAHCCTSIADIGNPQHFGTGYTFFFFFNCMFYQVLGVPHSSFSTRTWGSVLPSIVEKRDQNSRGCPLLFSNRNLGSFCA